MSARLVARLRWLRRDRLDSAALGILAHFYWRRYRTGPAHALARAVWLCARLRDEAPESLPDLLVEALAHVDSVVAGAAPDFGDANETRLFLDLANLWTDGVQELRRSVAATRIALRLSGNEHSLLVLLGARWFALAFATREDRDIDECVAVLRNAIETASIADPHRSRLHGLLCEALTWRHEVIELAGALRAALKDLEPRDRVRRELTRLAASLEMPVDLDEAVAVARLRVELYRAPQALHAAVLFQLASCLDLRAQATSSLVDADEAIGILRTIVGDTSVMERVGLSECLQFRFRLTQDREALAEAVTVAREAARLGHPDQGAVLTTLGSALLLSDDLDGAIEVLRDAVAEERPGGEAERLLGLALGATHDMDAVPLLSRQVAQVIEADPGLAGTYQLLGTAMWRQYGESGAIEDLDLAIEHFERAHSEWTALTPGHATIDADLGGALLTRAEDTASGSSQDLDRAMEVLRTGHACANPDCPDHSRLASMLAAALTFQYECRGTAGDLDEAIDVLRAGTTPDELGNLAVAYLRRFELTQSSEDLHHAIETSRQALELDDNALVIVNLGNSLISRYEIDHNEEDLQEAFMLLSLAADPDQRPVVRAAALNNVSRGFAGAYRLNGDEGDLDQAVAYQHQALELLPEGHPSQGMYRHNLGYLCFLQGDFDAAVELMSAPGGTDPTSATRLAHLAAALVAGSPANLEAALDALRTAANNTTAPAVNRVLAAQLWGELAAEAGDLVDAREGFSKAVRLLPILAWRGITRADQERRLLQFSGLARDAAALAVTTGQPELAVELLDQGRGVLWAQLRATRSDLGSIRERLPKLALRLDELRDQFDLPPEKDPTTFAAPEPVDKSRLASEWDQIVATVQEHDADFLAPRRFDQLAVAAAEGPVVVVNISAYGCDALIVTLDGIQTVPLPAVTPEALAVHHESLRLAYQRQGLAAVLARHQAVTRVLAWLGEQIVRPVLDVTGDTERLWWCPTGLLAFLPLHAAAPDHVVSSYTPTLQALIEARQAAPTGNDRMLVIAMPQTPGAHPLTVEPEVEAVTSPFADRCTILTGPQALHRRVNQLLAEHSRVHFACHGKLVPDQPSHSAVLLHDRPLTVLELARQQLTGMELAFLSACDTAGRNALPDEAIHPAAAFRMVGFRHVIATLWPVYDDTAPQFARAFYQALASAPSTAHALHDAIRQFRDDPTVWTPYIHLGP
ncbi:CHAT domain-containing tetratricopeptide repeat protein [Nonomuraea angiospora]|uniref:CHAT domain-containing protein n=1 Tax=Nonomuraea angiospora TaxID=46172 RepID=UPI00341D6580